MSQVVKAYMYTLEVKIKNYSPYANGIILRYFMYMVTVLLLANTNMFPKVVNVFSKSHKELCKNINMN